MSGKLSWRRPRRSWVTCQQPGVLRTMRSETLSPGCCLSKFGSKTTGLQPLSHNPVSHPSSLGTVKCDVYQAEATGFEPAISALTGLHVRPLHHASSTSEHTNRLSSLSTRPRATAVGSADKEMYVSA